MPSEPEDAIVDTHPFGAKWNQVTKCRDSRFCGWRVVVARGWGAVNNECGSTGGPTAKQWKG
jgi:hypothetical protein